MTEYLHHVPGRLRVRSKHFRTNSVSRGTVLRKLRALDGVGSVRLNDKAGSVTVCYDTEVTDQEAIIALLKSCDCLKTDTKHHRIESDKRTPRTSNPGHGISAQIGKMALGVLVNKGVSYSISSLLGARA